MEKQFLKYIKISASVLTQYMQILNDDEIQFSLIKLAKIKSNDV